jgi:hypothetical protein
MDTRPHLRRFLSTRTSSAQLEKWCATARSVPPKDPLSCTIKVLLDTTNEGEQPTCVSGVVLKAPTDLVNRLGEEASLRSKLDDVNKAMASFVSNYLVTQNVGLFISSRIIFQIQSATRRS